LEIRTLIEEDYPFVAQIYSDGLATGIATFETEVPSWEHWNVKFLIECRYVILIDQQIAGWCALSAISKRNVYKGVAESTIYIGEKFQLRGLATLLLQHLIIESELAGFWTLQASIFPQNRASIHLHQKSGFRFVGIREKIAQRDEVWYDNILLERRTSLLPETNQLIQDNNS